MADRRRCLDHLGRQAPRGIVGAISPWNFPLAIFTGQIAAALMAGNAVIAKPAEATPIIAAYGVRLLHQAGVPLSALQLLPGRGSVVGAALTADPRVRGVVFTGSTDTARTIARTMAEKLVPGTPLIAETGGLNACGAQFHRLANVEHDGGSGLGLQPGVEVGRANLLDHGGRVRSESATARENSRGAAPPCPRAARCCTWSHRCG